MKITYLYDFLIVKLPSNETDSNSNVFSSLIILENINAIDCHNQIYFFFTDDKLKDVFYYGK